MASNAILVAAQAAMAAAAGKCRLVLLTAASNAAGRDRFAASREARFKGPRTKCSGHVLSSATDLPPSS